MPHRDTRFCDIDCQINGVAPELVDIFIFCKPKLTLGILPFTLATWPLLWPACEVHDGRVTVNACDLVWVAVCIAISMHPAAGHTLNTTLLRQLVLIANQVAEALHDIQ